MRIIAGRLGGRPFDSPRAHKAHPMSEKIRGALFNALGDIEGLSVLDAFGGSGALSFEAISRGAQSAIVIEIDQTTHSNILKNIRMLQVEDNIKAVRASANGWSNNNADTNFDIILLDPPYEALKSELLEKMSSHAKPGGTVVLSLPPKTDFALPSTNYHLLSIKSYGDAQLVFYRKK